MIRCLRGVGIESATDIRLILLQDLSIHRNNRWTVPEASDGLNWSYPPQSFFFNARYQANMA
uniref:Uncharacterized protein n=1 Tax=Pseudomonas aeruginosa TaxID=287 RepID=A0A5P9WB20_PSEAI|nr:hypothetical protein pNK546KPC_0257 [Pseudomonas aeruginosa]